MSGRRRAAKESTANGLETAARKRSRSLAALGYTKPQTYEELRAVLSSGTVHFPKRLRQVAVFLWQHPSEVALGTIAQVADHIDYIAKRIGVRHVGIGGDFDGNDKWPENLSDVSMYPNLFAELVRRGWSDNTGPVTSSSGAVQGNRGGPSMGGDFDLARRFEVCVAGSPSTLREYVARWEAESTANYFVGAFQWGDLDHEEAQRSLELFAEVAIGR